MFLIVIDLVLWTTARHETSHGLLAWLEGAQIQDSWIPRILDLPAS
jgi:hypothetical protein